MEIRQLRHFLALAQEMHFGRAAERLCITQPALSTSILRLEEDFGVRLFERDSKGVRLTLAGDLMLGCAREVLSHTDRTKSFSNALSAGRLGRLEVGFSGTVLHHDLDKVILDYREAFPDIEILMREATSQKQTELLRNGRLDAGLVSFPLPPVGLEHIELFEDRFGICLPTDHPLATRKTIDVAELRDEPFIMPSREQTPSIRDQLEGLCATAGFQPRVFFESLHALSTVSLVSRGQGVGFVLESMKNVDIKGVVFVPLDRLLPRRCGYFVWSASRQAPGLQTLIDCFKSYATLCS